MWSTKPKSSVPEKEKEKEKENVINDVFIGTLAPTKSNIVGSESHRTVPQQNLTVLDGLDSVLVEKYKHRFQFEGQGEFSKRYKVMNLEGHSVFWVGENVDSASKCWRGMQRRYEFSIYSIQGDLMFKVERKRFQFCPQWSCPSELETKLDENLTNSEIMTALNTFVYHAQGNVLGQLINNSSACMPQYEVEDEWAHNILNLRSHCCGTLCHLISCQNNNFYVYDAHRSYLGKIQKKVKVVDDRDRKRICMGAKFPQHVTPLMKVLILAAMFEINVTYFDRRLSTVDIIWACVILGLLLITVLSCYFVAIFVMKS